MLYLGELPTKAPTIGSPHKWHSPEEPCQGNLQLGEVTNSRNRFDGLPGDVGEELGDAVGGKEGALVGVRLGDELGGDDGSELGEKLGGDDGNMDGDDVGDEVAERLYFAT